MKQVWHLKDKKNETECAHNHISEPDLGGEENLQGRTQEDER